MKRSSIKRSRLADLALMCSLFIIFSSSASGEGPPMVINHGVSGSWYEPATDGQGFSIETVPASNTMVAYWFTYTITGDGPAWFIAIGDISGATASLTVYETDGGIFDTPSEVSTTPVGSAELVFNDCTSAKLDYESSVVTASGSVPLTRLTPDVNCAQSLAAAQTTFVTRQNSWIDGQGEWVFEGCVELGASESHGDELFVFSEDTLHFKIDRYDTADCSGPRTLWIMDFRVERVDKHSSMLDGQEVITNGVVLVDAVSGDQTKQVFYFDVSGPIPLMTHGTLDSPPDAEGFPSELPELFFELSP